MFRRFKGVISISFIILFCSSVFGVPTLDQYQNNNTGGTAPLSTWKMAQTFTAGITGILDSVEIGCTSTGTTTWEIWETTAGVPSGTVLGSVTVTSDMSLGWNTIDMTSEGITVNAGTMYAIVNYFSAGGYEDLLIEFDPDSYAAGQLWIDFGSGDGWEVFSVFGGGDLQFRTYVEPSTIPVPGTVLLASFGTVIVGLMRRRKTI